MNRSSRIRWSPMVTVLVTIGLANVAPGRVGADCSGPYLELNRLSVGPGEMVVVTGEAFGDNCHDLGAPPPGEGVLGEPLTDITVTINGPGAAGRDLASLDADGQYHFEIRFAAPASDGTYQVRARVPSDRFVSPVTLRVGAATEGRQPMEAEPTVTG